MEDALPYLRRAHDQGLLVPFVGAGLGSAAAGLPSWSALIGRALDYAVSDLGMTTDDQRLVEVRNSAATGDQIATFDLIQDIFSRNAQNSSSTAYDAFLADVFADPKVTSTALLEALHFLRPRRVVTTNYDLLLENFGIGGGKSATWQDPTSIRDMFRLGEGIVHLHGTWNRPDSIILSKRSYDRISADAPAKQIAEVIFHARVLLFICTSLDGTHDPHLADLLKSFESIADPVKGESAPHVMLLRGQIRGEEHARLNRQGIRAVSYGADHKDLPAFLHQIAATGQVQINTRPVDNLVNAVTKSATIDDAIRAVGNWIASDVFAGREVRVAFSAKRASADGFLLKPQALIPSSSSGNPHNYPLSMSAWALLEGRPISWPYDRDRVVDFKWLRRIRKLDQIVAMVKSSAMEASPELRAYTDLDAIRRNFDDETLKLGDFFQDWASDQPDPPYAQFVSVPVPWVDTAPNREELPEFGVFNIDSRERPPLMDGRVEALLRLASKMTENAFRLFKDAEGVPATQRRRRLSVPDWLRGR